LALGFESSGNHARQDDEAIFDEIEAHVCVDYGTVVSGSDGDLNAYTGGCVYDASFGGEEACCC
jgi:hypothetical protein